MSHTQSILKKTYLLLAILLFASRMAVLADTPNTKVVKVGWYESAYNHMDEKGRRSGYAYEYQQRLAANTGWKYEYVEGTWVELFKKLQNGEIDILSDVSRTEERENTMLFSDREMGKEDFYITKLASNTAIKVGELNTLRGKRIGVNKGSLQDSLLTEWTKTHSLGIEILRYEVSENQYIEMLKRGELDAVAAVTAFQDIAGNMCLPVAHIGSSEIYFAINKQRPDLKLEMDRAMSKILSQNAYYDRDLHEVYFSNKSMFNYLPTAETNWINKHGVIRIGYRDNYMPFCGTHPLTGRPMGLLVDFMAKMTEMFKNINLRFEAVPYPSTSSVIEALNKGEVDVAFPNGMGVFDSEAQNLESLDPLLKSSEMAIIRNNSSLKINEKMRAAVSNKNPNYIALIKEKYPHWDFVEFNTTEECLQGIAEGKADLLLISNYRLSVLNNDMEQMHLKAVATGGSISLAFATRKGEPEIYSIMIRLTHMMPQSEIHASLAKHSESQRKVTIMEFVKSNSLFVIVFLTIIIAVFIILLRRRLKDHHRAEAASQAKTRFLFNMSHDIRTPMNAIMGYTDLMKNHLGDVDKCRDYLDKIRMSSGFLLDLINNVLEMSRIESGKTELNEQPQMLGQTITSLKELYTELMQKKGINFSTHMETQTKAIYCDHVKVSEICLNLLSNAYKYTPKGGSVSLNFKELPSEKEGWITIRTTVADTGIGMSKEYLPHIFEDFTREQTYTDNKIAGTGLGMSIVKKLVELMGGTISVESELGKGTTFVLDIQHRIADPALVEKGHDEDENINFEGMHLLMAEDNDLNAEIAEEVLGAMGFDVDRAENGQECIDILVEAPAHTYDAILMDVQMPIMNGYDAARAIRQLQDAEKANIPILAMTANAFAKDKQDAIDSGMNGHIAKPIEREALIHTLAKNLKK